MTLSYWLFGNPGNLDEFLRETGYKLRTSANITEIVRITEWEMLGGKCELTVRSGDISVTLKKGLDVNAFLDSCRLGSYSFAISVARELTSQGLETTILGESIANAEKHLPQLEQNLNDGLYGHESGKSRQQTF